MDRRQFVQVFGASFVSALGLGLASNWQAYQAQTAGVRIKWLGHTCFLFTGGGQTFLVNPFRRIGCTEGYRPVTVAADLVMISSRLFDEGYLQDLPDDPQVLVEPGVYNVNGIRVQGIQVAHDRQGGQRFGSNTIWQWNQGGINIVHMGGAAGPVGVEQQILLGRPDVLLVPVGGGPKAYNAQEAVQAVQTLKPKLVIPTHYRTAAADGESCDTSSVDDFLTLMQGTPTSIGNGDTLTVDASKLPAEGMRIQTFAYAFSPQPSPAASPQPTTPATSNGQGQ